MGNGPDGLIVSQTRDRASIHDFEDASFGSGCGVGTLVENAPHVAVALRRPVAVVHARTLFVAGACTNPGGQTFRRRKRCGGGADFGDDLLRRLHTQPRHLWQPLDGVLVRMEQTGQFLNQSIDLLLEELQLLQRHLQEPPVDGLEVRTRAERITQLFRRGA